MNQALKDALRRMELEVIHFRQTEKGSYFLIRAAMDLIEKAKEAAGEKEQEEK